MYEKNGDIIQALKLKHGDSRLSHPNVFHPHGSSIGKEQLDKNAEMIMKYSVDPNAQFKIHTPIELSQQDKNGEKYGYELSDGNWIQKYLYKGSGKIVEMSPDDFLNYSAPMNSGQKAIMEKDSEGKQKFTGRYEKVSEPTSDNVDDYDQRSLKVLRENMGKKSGQMPNINVRLNDNGRLQVVGHEGRHRAFVAREKGIDKIPVMVATDHSDSRLPEKYETLIEQKAFDRE